jgi:hypothetical protein
MRTAYKIIVGLGVIPLALFLLSIILISTKTIGGALIGALFLVWAFYGAIIMLVVTALTFLYYLMIGYKTTICSL